MPVVSMGQYIYFDRLRGVVIAANGADRGFREPGAHDSNIAMFRKLADLAARGAE